MFYVEKCPSPRSGKHPSRKDLHQIAYLHLITLLHQTPKLERMRGDENVSKEMINQIGKLKPAIRQDSFQNKNPIKTWN